MSPKAIAQDREKYEAFLAWYNTPEASRQTQTEFCAIHHVKDTTLKRWKDLLDGGADPPVGEVDDLQRVLDNLEKRARKENAHPKDVELYLRSKGLFQVKEPEGQKTEITGDMIGRAFIAAKGELEKGGFAITQL
jgi:hypothetical protein